MDAIQFDEALQRLQFLIGDEDGAFNEAYEKILLEITKDTDIERRQDRAGRLRAIANRQLLHLTTEWLDLAKAEPIFQAGSGVIN